jgi:Tol biopolymer transport system component
MGKMKSQQSPWQIVGAMLLLLFLAACSICPSAPPQDLPTPTLAPTPISTLPTATPTPIPPTATPTPIPPTATPWPDSCQIAFLSDRGDDRLSGIFVLSADGSGLGRLDTGLAGERVTSMAWSPDCEKIAFTSEDTYGQGHAFVMNADGSDRRRIDDETVREGIVQGMTQVFPAYEELERKWEAEGYSLSDAVRLANLHWSPDGRRIAFAAGIYVPEGIMNFGIYLINADGSGLTRLAPDRAAAEEVFRYYKELDDEYFERSREWIQERLEIQDWVDLLPFVAASPAWSPDGRKIAFKLGFVDKLWLYVIRADGSELTCLGSSVIERNAAVAWSPDSGRIAFVADGGDNIYVVNAAGGEPACLTDGEAFYDSLAWSPDGRQIAFVSRPTGDTSGSSDIYVMNADGSGLTNLTDEPGEDTNPVWSPDGSKIAFESTRDGSKEIYVMDADGSNRRNLTRHPADDSAPVWLQACAPIPTLSPAEIPTLVPTPTPTPVEFGMSCDVSASLTGPAGDPASREPETVLSITIQGGEAAQVTIELPSGETVAALPLGSYEEYQIFYQSFEGLPQTGGAYTCIALDAGGTPIPGGEVSDVYLGGYEPDPPANVKAEVVEDGIWVTWDPSPTIPGGFDPGGVPPLGSYNIFLDREDREEGISPYYRWSQMGASLKETSHLIPFRRQHFALGDEGLALEEMDDGFYHLELSAFSLAPEGTAGQGVECTSTDPAETVHIIIEEGQVRIE